MADANTDTWEPEMDVKPMVMLKWSVWPPERGHYRIEWPARITFWQLVRMKMKPLHQKWVLWMPACDLPEDDLGEDDFPFTVDLHRDSSTDGVDGIQNPFCLVFLLKYHLYKPLQIGVVLHLNLNKPQF